MYIYIYNIMQTGGTGAVEVGDNMYQYNMIYVMMIIIEAVQLNNIIYISYILYKVM